MAKGKGKGKRTVKKKTITMPKTDSTSSGKGSAGVPRLRGIQTSRSGPKAPARLKTLSGSKKGYPFNLLRDQRKQARQKFSGPTAANLDVYQKKPVHTRKDMKSKNNEEWGDRVIMKPRSGSKLNSLKKRWTVRYGWIWVAKKSRAKGAGVGSKPDYYWKPVERANTDYGKAWLKKKRGSKKGSSKKK